MKNAFRLVLLVSVLSWLVAVPGCTPWKSVSRTDYDWSGEHGGAGNAQCQLSAARSLAVVLQDVDFDELRRQDPDVIVIDYSKSGGSSGELTAEDVKALKERPGVDRIVLAYMSIGEAESYRYYWPAAPEQEEGQEEGQAQEQKAQKDPTSMPGYIVKINPDWAENYRVKYWDPEWRSVLAGKSDSYLSRILSQGFDGVFLDTVDTAEVYLEEEMADAPALMLDLVKFITETARASDPDFLVVAQNPYVILELDGATQAISGVSAENVLFDNGSIRSASDLVPVLENLNKVKAAGRSVISIEYITDPIQLSLYEGLCTAMGYLCYPGVRALNHLEPLMFAGNGAVCQ
jgi:cysteinyl-tRNA synthetase